MKTCASCRYLAGEREDSYPYGPPPTSQHRTCVRVIHANGTFGLEESWGPYKKQPAVVLDGSGYAARFAVLPTFGCVLHEERDSTSATEKK